MNRRINDGAKQRTVEDLRRRYDFDAMLEASIIDEGELDSGRYIKYGNGRLEFFSNKLSSGALIKTPARNVFYTNDVIIPLSLGLASKEYYVDFNIYSLSGAIGVLIQSKSTADRLVIRFMSSYSTATPIGYKFKLVGGWK